MTPPGLPSVCLSVCVCLYLGGRVGVELPSWTWLLDPVW